MKITADTNVLVRSAANDHAHQVQFAQRTLAEAEAVVVTLPALCEFVWVLDRYYRQPADAIARAIHALVSSENVVANLPAVTAGLAHLIAGGDFADGVIAHEGRDLGGTTFVSFDRKAVRIANELGSPAILLK